MDILAAASRYCMFAPGDLVVAAVSGGPDSVAMLHALHTSSESLGITLHVAHLNHGIRGEESDIDQEFVAKLAQKLGLPCTARHIDVPQMRVEMRMGEEEAARELRYKFLQETCATLNADKIAVAHNADDRAESVMLNIIRGSGTAGLGSIRPVRGNIVRPLIDTTREDIMGYIEEYSLPFRIDESNLDINYSRNRIRHELLPLLKETYNPQIIDALNRLADISLPEDDYLAHEASTYASSIRMRSGLDAGLLAGLPLAIQRRIVRAEIERFKGNLVDITLEQTDRIVDAIQTGSDFTITLPSGKLFTVCHNHEFSIRPLEIIEPAAAYSRELLIPGQTPVPESDLVIEAEVLHGARPAKLPPTEIIIDMRSISGPLSMRPPHPGDRIIPFGMNGAKKLQDVFVDKKVHRRDRAMAVVVEDNEKILWVAGIIASEATRIAVTAPEAIHLAIFTRKN